MLDQETSKRGCKAILPEFIIHFLKGPELVEQHQHQVTRVALVKQRVEVLRDYEYLVNALSV